MINQTLTPEWLQALFAGAAVLASVLSFLSAAFMWRMRSIFVPRPEIEARFVAIRSEIDVRLGSMSGTLLGFDKRLRDVENSASATAATIGGVKDIVVRIDHMTGLLVEHRLRESENG